MTENIPATQYIALEDERTMAVFTEDGRVFYDMSALLTTYTPEVFAKALIAKISGDTEGENITRGQRLLLMSIMRDADRLLTDNGHESLTDRATSALAEAEASTFDPDRAPWDL